MLANGIKSPDMADSAAMIFTGASPMQQHRGSLAGYITGKPLESYNVGIL